MWAHSDVPRQWDAGIQELSWDIPKLHSLWKKNPSASRKTPDLENWRPGYRITEMWVRLPYHRELFNITRYVRDKAVVDAWTGKSVSKRQLSKTQEMSVLSSSFLYSSVLFSVWEAIVPLCVVLPRLRVLPCCAAEGLLGLWHSSPEGSAFRHAELDHHRFGTANPYIYISPVPFLCRERYSSQARQRWETGVNDPVCLYS